MSDDGSGTPLPWPGPARAVVDIFPEDGMSRVDVIGRIGDVVDDDVDVNVLSLGPPVRVQLPSDRVVDVLDAVDYERVKILHWPFSTRPRR